ncbi:hypothetical protein [Nonomuraea rubra]|uniref:hypothetical protein n=1 Tax=Nonomuraea rubra TaxID=46180 RepID=UPI0031E58ADB
MSDTLGELAYAEAGSIYNDPVAPGAAESGTAMLGELDATAVQAILDLAGPHAPVPHVVELRHLGGRLAHLPAVDNAIGQPRTRDTCSTWCPGWNAPTSPRSGPHTRACSRRSRRGAPVAGSSTS